MTPTLTPADRLLYSYCGRDCCCTFECNEVMERKLQPGQRRHYQFNLSLLAPLLYMELRGIRYDHEKAKIKLKRIQKWIYVLQDMLNRAACGQGSELASLYEHLLHRPQTEAVRVQREQGGVCGGDSMLLRRGENGRNMEVAGEPNLVALLRDRLCLAKPRRRRQVTTTRTFKNGKTKTTTKVVSEPVEISNLEDCLEFALESKRDEVQQVLRLLRRGSGTAAARGELSTLLNLHVKVNSTGADGDACRFLYETCAFNKHYQKEGNRLTDRLASDDEALIKIWVEETKKPVAWPADRIRLRHRGRLALIFLKLRRLITQTKTLRVAPDADGRMRCGYNVVGTETGRLTCYESPTGSGFNLQTVTKPHRSLFLADPGCLLAQCDLSGADGWTVAAYAAAQGDRTMLEDYRAGIKPAKVGVLMWQQGPAISKLDRAKLKELCKTVDGGSWQYFGFKRVQHGSSYQMGKQTMSDQILTDSWKLTGKPVFIPAGVCESMQHSCFFARYWGIPRWHSWMEQEIKKGSLTASNGFTRRFFGRRDDHGTLKQALAHLPQVMTTWSTMLALLRMWSDPDNRRPDGALKCEPLHTIHDAILDQFKEELREWAAAKHQEWFNNPVLIASETLTIPFEGACGRDWKNLEPL